MKKPVSFFACRYFILPFVVGYAKTAATPWLESPASIVVRTGDVVLLPAGSASLHIVSFSAINHYL